MKKMLIALALVAVFLSLPVKAVMAESLVLTENGKGRNASPIGHYEIRLFDEIKSEGVIPQWGKKIEVASSRADILISINTPVIVFYESYYEVLLYTGEYTFNSLSIDILPMITGCEKVIGLHPMDPHDEMYYNNYCQQ